eukprot:1790885-Rhodomonas_salina.3
MNVPGGLVRLLSNSARASGARRRHITPPPVLTYAISLRSCYAMSGIVIAYGATRCAVLTYGILLLGSTLQIAITAPSGELAKAVCYPLRACYAMSGTDIAYGSVSLQDVQY